MRPGAWYALLLALAVVVLAIWWERPAVIPYTGVGAFKGTAVTAYAETSGGANRYMTFESPAGTDYQVPTGKTLRITRIVYQSAAAGVIVLGYGNDGVAMGTSAPTTPKAVIGVSGAAPQSALIADTGGKLYEVFLFASVPAGKYPFLQASGTTSAVQIFGVEQ